MQELPAPPDKMASQARQVLRVQLAQLAPQVQLGSRETLEPQGVLASLVNQEMWEHPVLQDHKDSLDRLGIQVSLETLDPLAHREIAESRELRAHLDRLEPLVSQDNLDSLDKMVVLDHKGLLERLEPQGHRV